MSLPAAHHLCRAEAFMLAALDELDAAVLVLTSAPQTRAAAVYALRKRELLLEVLDRRDRPQRGVRRLGQI